MIIILLLHLLIAIIFLCFSIWYYFKMKKIWSKEKEEEKQNGKRL